MSEKLNELRSLVQCRVQWNGNDTFTLYYVSGQKVFHGSPQFFAKWLRKLKAKDRVSTPKSRRIFTYEEMVQRIMDGKDPSVWIWSNELNQLKDLEGITIFEEVKVKMEPYTLNLRD